MTESEIKTRLKDIFVDVLDISAIELDRKTTASDIDEWDSLAHISLLVAIEKEFGIKFELTEIKNLQNVGDMLDLIARKMKEK